MPTILGVDIGGTSVKVSVRTDGQFVHAGQSPFYAKPTRDELLAAIHAAVENVRDVDAVGLCVPGLLNDDRTQVTLAVNVPGLVGVRLDELVPRALGLSGSRPTTVCNDALAAAHEVYTSRQLRGRLLVLTLGTGVGGAVIDDNCQPLRVDGDSPGHIGQLDVSIPGHDFTGPDGGAGGLEGYMGVAALRRDYGTDFPRAIASFTGDEPPILALVRATRICHAIYRPQHVCLCGGIGIRLRHLLPQVRRRIADRLTSLARPGWTLDCGTDDFHAARGAAQLAARSPSLHTPG